MTALSGTLFDNVLHNELHAIKNTKFKYWLYAVCVISIGFFGASYLANGFSLAQAALLTPLLVLTFSFGDLFASSQQPDLFDDPLVGRKVTAIESFRPMDGGFEGRVLLNGATWNARCNQRMLEEGEKAQVSVREGHLLRVI